MEAILALIVDPLALWLESFALSPSVWYLTSRQHIIETFFVTLYFILTSLICQKLPHSENLLNYKEYKLTLIEKVLGSILTLTYILHWFYKYLRDPISYKELFWMLQPCHVQSAILIYSTFIYSQRSAYWFNVILFLQWGFMIAILIPDNKAKTLPFEIPVFWVHHIVGVILPLVLLHSNRYKVEKSLYFILYTTGIFTFLHFIILNPISIITGININYILFPAKGQPFTGNNYRIFTIIVGNLGSALMGTLGVTIEQILLKLIFGTKEKKY